MEFDDGALRPGQREALGVIEQRVRRGKKTTAVILPCRYGKSDVARLASLKMWDEGLISATIALSPNTVLRGQLADTAKWDTALIRYRVKVSREPVISSMDRLKIPVTPNGEMFVSITTHLASSQLDIWCSWVESQVHKTGLPVLVVVDECHTGSEANEWGRIVPALTAAGAHVVLLTATAERADGKRIPGFQFETEAVEDVTIYRCSKGSRPELVKVDVMAGCKTRLRLVADCEVTFASAWEMGALCKVARNPFDIDLRTVKGLREEHQWLSEMSESRSRELLGRIVREPKVICEGCQRLVDSLRSRRRIQPDAKAIIFCGNDREDGETNAHPQAIRRALKRIDPGFDVLVATSTEGDGEATVQRFINGHGDILIVKQMAGIGLDIGPLKIGLDLSPTRTYASFVQRMMRPATPHAGIMAMEWISPDDVLSAAHFEKLVTSGGGEATAADLAVIHSYEKERNTDADNPLTLFPENVGPGDFDDSGSNRAGREQWAVVSQLVETFPELLAANSHAEIAARFDAAGLEFAEREQPEVAIRNTAQDADAVRLDLNNLAKEVTQRRMTKWGYDRSRYGLEIQQVWADAKTAGRWPHATELKDCDDLHALGRMRTVLESWVAEIAQGDTDAY